MLRIYCIPERLAACQEGLSPMQFVDELVMTYDASVLVHENCECISDIQTADWQIYDQAGWLKH
jgi:hypothetical protein